MLLRLLSELASKARNKYRKDGFRSLLFEGPTYFISKSKEKLNQLPSIICTKKFEMEYGEGTDIIDEDWDNLIIFDACRYDEFKKEQYFGGDTKKIVSKGRDSDEFISENFYGRELHDTVYITSNPHVSNIEKGVFHHIVDEPLREYFDSELGTVHPKHVTRAATEAHEEFPNKRLIIHYMQPHMPPIGKSSEYLRDLSDRFSMTGHCGNSGRFYNMVENGSVSPEEAKKAYRENLSIVFDESDRLLKNINGKSVLTADHGELLGESPCFIIGPTWSHGLTRDYFPKSEELCLVPWLEIKTGERRSITLDYPVDSTRLSSEKAKSQLKDLGYIE